MGAFAYNKIAHAPTNFNNNNPNAKWILLEAAYKSTPSQIDNQKNYKRLLTKGLETIYNIFGVFAQGELPEGYRQTPVKLFSNNPEEVFVENQANAIVLYPYNPEYCFEVENGIITNYLKDNNECGEMVSIPNSINGNTIHTIGAQAFENKGISYLYLPSSLTTIQSKAFNQNQITTIQIPNNLISIQELAFANNPGEDALNGKVQGIIQINKDPASVNIAVDANIELMIPPTDESCFGFYNGEIQRYDRNCESDVVIPQTINGQEVIGIGDRAFNGMNLNSVIIPNSVQYILE